MKARYLAREHQIQLLKAQGYRITGMRGQYYVMEKR